MWAAGAVAALFTRFGKIVPNSNRLIVIGLFYCSFGGLQADHANQISNTVPVFQTDKKCCLLNKLKASTENVLIPTNTDESGRSISPDLIQHPANLSVCRITESYTLIAIPAAHFSSLTICGGRDEIWWISAFWNAGKLDRITHNDRSRGCLARIDKLESKRVGPVFRGADAMHTEVSSRLVLTNQQSIPVTRQSCSGLHASENKRGQDESQSEHGQHQLRHRKIAAFASGQSGEKLSTNIPVFMALGIVAACLLNCGARFLSEGRARIGWLLIASSLMVVGAAVWLALS